MAPQAAKLHTDTREKKRNALQSGGQISMGIFTQILSSGRPKMRLWDPKPAPGPSPGFPQLRDTPRHSGAGPETPCFVSRLPPNTSKVLASLLGFWKLRNFLRPINASSASMKEATAKRHLPVWIGLRLVLCPVPPPTSQSFVLGHGTCAGQRRL